VEFVGDIFNQFTDRGMVRAQGLGRFAEPLTVVGIVALINFMNFIDGHDGLAGSISVSSLVGLTILILLPGQETHLGIILLLGSVLSAFLLFNWPLQITKKKRVYMGDAGSMFVGLFLAFLLIELSQPGQGMRGWDNQVLSPPVALWLVGLPLLDGLSVIGMRLLRGKSPIRADRGHIHHCLKGLGKSDAIIALVLLGANMALVVAGVFFIVFEAEDSIVFWSFLFLNVVYSVVKYRFCLKDGLPV
jgi:UDP-GlcNAc:undecaprenyl-phosphate GlcNAc-1-phosphate transferase